MSTLDALRSWMTRKHERVCDRNPAAGCTCPAEITDVVLADTRKHAAHIHAKFGHPGTPEACQEPHDNLCKAVWP